MYVYTYTQLMSVQQFYCFAFAALHRIRSVGPRVRKLGSVSSESCCLIFISCPICISTASLLSSLSVSWSEIGTTPMSINMVLLEGWATLTRLCRYVLTYVCTCIHVWLCVVMCGYMWLCVFIIHTYMCGYVGIG